MMASFFEQEPASAKLRQQSKIDKLETVIVTVDSELREVARRSTQSVLRKNTFTGLSHLDFAEIVKEMKTLCPVVHTLLSGMLEMDAVASEKKTISLALIYSLIMFRRCHELIRVQRVNAILLCEGDANQEVCTITHTKMLRLL